MAYDNGCYEFVDGPPSEICLLKYFHLNRHISRTFNTLPERRKMQPDAFIGPQQSTVQVPSREIETISTYVQFRPSRRLCMDP